MSQTILDALPLHDLLDSVGETHEFNLALGCNLCSLVMNFHLLIVSLISYTVENVLKPHSFVYAPVSVQLLWERLVDIGDVRCET